MHTLKSFFDELAARAEARGYPGSVLLSEAQVRLFYALARKEGAVHPSDDQTISVDGYAYLKPVQLRSGAFQVRYYRVATAAELTARFQEISAATALRKERDAAVGHYAKTGDISKIEDFLRMHPEEATR